MHLSMRAVSSLIQPQIALFKNKCHYGTFLCYSKENWVNFLLHFFPFHHENLALLWYENFNY